ncbi:YEATS domain-containing protein 2-like [Palaemon carinicauda]|uniref:YEATS domain-containing protein 2-like n=1 Tax=Palaemon carinicauda TaxID=392227 RepID=UPI0035B5F3D2
MEEDSEDELREDTRNQCCKRMLSTEDPDYTRPPEPKRMKEMEERAQDELRDRVIKVVDGVLSSAANEKQAEMEEIDARILRVQQCLHTLRYCVSLNYHTVDKLVSSVSKDKQIYEVHPAVRKHMGKAPVNAAASGSSDLSSLDSSTPSQIALNSYRKDDVSGHGRLQFNEESSSKGKLRREVSEISFYSESDKMPNKYVCTDGNDKSSLLRNEDKMQKSTGKNLELSRPPSPKYLPPKPPDSQIIAQGRHQKFQSKRRIVVGNTYQYLTPQTGRDAEDAMRYKWQIYVRVPPQENSIDTFVSGVTFILDKSYAPHHIITLKHPPFVLSRRGWGEFKVQIVLNFNDTRNKKVQFLHPLVLCRPDDPLALTGLWRLGQENWYDVWVYEGSSGVESKDISEELTVEDEESPAKLERELLNGTISSQLNENVTVCHDGDTHLALSSANVKLVKEENVISDNHLRVENCGSTISDVDNSVFVKIPVSGKTNVTENDSQNKCDNIKGESKCKAVPSIGINDNQVKCKNVNPGIDTVPIEKETSPTKPSVSNGIQSKMCKIHVRQPDGKLVPYFIPAHMYSLAVKIANMRSSDTSKSPAESSEVDGGVVKSSQKSGGAVNQLLDEPSGSISKTVSLLTIPESGTKKDGRDVAGRSVKEETPVKNVTYTNILAASEVKDPPSKKKNDGDVVNNKSTPVKILNFSHKNLTKVGPLTDGGSSVSNIQNVTNVVQSKPILMKSGNLSQSALLQLLSKVGIKDGNNAKQQLLLKTGIKGVNLTSLQKAQAQFITAKATQGTKCNIHLMPVKILQDKEKPKSQEGTVSSVPLSARLSSQSVQPTNFKLVTNDGQMITTENLPKGTIISSATKGNTASKSIPMKNTIFTVRTSDLKGMTGNLKEGTSIMMQDGRILAKLSTGVQGVSSQGSATTSKINLVQCSSSTGKGRQVHVSPLVIGRVNNKDAKNLQTSTLALPVKAVTSENNQMPITSVTVLAKDSLVSPVASTKTKVFDPKAVASASRKIVNNLPSSSTDVLPMKSDDSGANTVYSEDNDRLDEVTSNTLEEQKLTGQDIWEEKTRKLIAISKSCSSVEQCVSLWVRALPLISSSGSTRSLFPYQATSSENFLKWPLGKQRASEFQRSREVKRWLDMCEVHDKEKWTVRRIVGWTRRYGYTPIPYRGLLLTDGIIRRDSHLRPDTTLSCLSNLENFTEGASHLWLRSQDSRTQDIDITTADDTTLRGRKRKLLASPSKSASEIIPWTDSDMVNGCEWVGRRSSELCINLPVEEILPGYRADAGRAVAWQAALSFMEDLLRSSYCQAWEEKSSDPNVVPPKSITLSHVRDALLNTRPEFDLFTNEGLGAVTKDPETS